MIQTQIEIIYNIDKSKEEDENLSEEKFLRLRKDKRNYKMINEK